jgi:hypothetical protein
MKVLIIPDERVEKIKNMEFDGWNRLDPIAGELDGKQVFFLQAELKDNKIFAKVLNDFEACEIKEIETIEPKFFDTKGTEIKPNSEGKLIDKGKELDIFQLTCKTILNAKL